MHLHVQSHELVHISTLSYACIDYKSSCFCVLYYIVLSRVGFPGGSVVKNPPAKKEIGFDPLVGKIPCKRKRQLTLVLLLRKPHGLRSLLGYNPQGHRRVRHDVVTKIATTV